MATSDRGYKRLSPNRFDASLQLGDVVKEVRKQHIPNRATLDYSLLRCGAQASARWRRYCVQQPMCRLSQQMEHARSRGVPATLHQKEGLIATAPFLLSCGLGPRLESRDRCVELVGPRHGHAVCDFLRLHSIAVFCVARSGIFCFVVTSAPKLRANPNQVRAGFGMGFGSCGKALHA